MNRWLITLFLLLTTLCHGQTVATNAPAVQTNTPALLSATNTNTVRTLSAAQTKLNQRKIWAELQTNLPPVPSFLEWQKKTSELPPDFTQIYPDPRIPDPLRGTIMHPKIPSDLLMKLWNDHRRAILNAYNWWVIGQAPPAPKNVTPTVKSARTEYLKCFAEEGTLQLGQDVRAQLNIQLFSPQSISAGTFPSIIIPAGNTGTTQSTLPIAQWVQTALSRGYIVCTYTLGAGLDGITPPQPGVSTNATRVMTQWEASDWSLLGKEIWSIRRVVDYLMTLPQTDKHRITVAGERFYAKAAIGAAAADPRISATIALSPGSASFTPFRAIAENYGAGGIAELTQKHPDWYHPRLRFFSGRENYLPFEQSDLVSCIIPRSLYVATQTNDPEDNLWGDEQTAQTLRQTYTNLGATYLRFYFRTQNTPAFTLENIQQTFDWLEYQWNWRTTYPATEFTYPTYPDWLKWTRGTLKEEPLTYPEKTLDGILSIPNGNPIATPMQWNDRRMEIRQQVDKFLGTPPPFFPTTSEYSPEPDAIASQMNRLQTPINIIKGGFTTANGVHIDFYFPEADTDPTTPTQEPRKLPVILWQPGFTVPRGYSTFPSTPHILMAQQGFLVVTFDPIGCGTRIDEIRNFYQRYPNWSLMGKMTQDISLAIDAIRQVPLADTKKIHIVGYDTGALIALYAAALDSGITSVTAIGALHPMRAPAPKLPSPFDTQPDTPQPSPKTTLDRWYLNPLLLPKFATFQG